MADISKMMQLRLFLLVVEELIKSRGNFCMMLSHPPRCLKGIPSSNKKHVGSLKYAGGGEWGYNKKTITFCLTVFVNEH